MRLVLASSLKSADCVDLTDNCSRFDEVHPFQCIFVRMKTKEARQNKEMSRVVVETSNSARLSRLWLRAVMGSIGEEAGMLFQTVVSFEPSMQR